MTILPSQDMPENIQWSNFLDSGTAYSLFEFFIKGVCFPFQKMSQPYQPFWIFHGQLNYYLYTKSLVNTNSFYTNFTNTHFQKVPISHLTRTMKQKVLHKCNFSFHVLLLTCLTRFLLNMTFS